MLQEGTRKLGFWEDTQSEDHKKQNSAPSQTSIRGYNLQSLSGLFGRRIGLLYHIAAAFGEGLYKRGIRPFLGDCTLSEL